MLAGLSALELGRLRMSVGYGRDRKGRPLSPVEVGLLLRKSLDQGESLRDCARAIQLTGVGHIGRFLRILELPANLRHLVNWGAGEHFIGFTAAVELVRIGDAKDQQAVAASILSHGLNSKEVRQVAQLRERSGRGVSDCIDEVLGMRSTIEKRYIFIGTVDEKSIPLLDSSTQAARDSLLEVGIDRLGLRGATGRLGAKIFTLVGGECFNKSMQDVGKENIEILLRAYIEEAIHSDALGS